MAGRDTYSTIVVSPEPRGRFVNGFCNGALRPGTFAEIDTSVAKISGSFTFKPYTPGASGARPNGPLAIVLGDELQGADIDTALTTGAMGWFYFPLPGDELLVMVDTGVNTATTKKMMLENATGVAIASATEECEPILLLESVGTTAADTLVHAAFSGF